MKTIPNRAALVGVSNTTAEMVVLMNDIEDAHRNIIETFGNLNLSHCKSECYIASVQGCYLAYRDALLATLGEMVADSLKHNPMIL